MRRITGLAGALAAAVCLAVGTVVTTEGAVPPCRVRNVTQDASGVSLIRMADGAVDGDRLRMRGTCPGVIIIRADIVITGVGDRPTLTGRGRTRAVRVQQVARATIRDLVITRGARVMRGAGILNDGHLTLLDVIVQGNSAREPVRHAFGGYGGGIANTGHLVLEHSTVRRNEALQSAGGIYNDGRMVIRDSLVTDNRTTVYQREFYGGGGIENEGRLRLVRSRVTDNVAQDRGGGIYHSLGGEVTIIRSTIARNQAELGGGIFNERRLVIKGSVLVGNKAQDRGGGIFNGASVYASLTALGTSIRSNTATVSGGGIYTDGRATLTGTTLSRNKALRGGGISNEGRLTLLRTSITANTARRKGGGIDNDRRATLTATTIARNTALRGGGIDNAGPLTLLRTSIRSNAATEEGGGILNEEGTSVTLDDSSSVNRNTPEDCVGTPAC